MGAVETEQSYPTPIAMAARVAADLSESDFAHLGWAAAAWIAGTAIWFAYVVPRIAAATPMPWRPLSR
jgi:hypothetical protein